ncbi:T9SS type A sorting domain-containing protein [candidate division KSB1 bacterium]|nr:T9SS type A sorting domain-containing protein [candidate division KSB1 bacterium]
MKYKYFFRTLFLLKVVGCTLLVSTSWAQTENEIIRKFQRRTHTFRSTTLPYRLFVPENYPQTSPYPLVLALHGAGERGTDNEAHIRVHRLATAWADTLNQRPRPCFVVAPQCPPNQRWVDSAWEQGNYRVAQVPFSNELATVYNLLDSLIREFAIDTTRLYVTGLSMGGYGTWDLVLRFPHRFAAAIPMSGGGDSTQARQIKHLPVWTFHGKIDVTVPVSGSRNMILALERLGNTCVFTHYSFHDPAARILPDSVLDVFLAQGAKMLYTEYVNGGHVIWAESYNNPRLMRWVFAQRKTPVAGVNQLNHSAPENSFAINYPNPFNAATQICYQLTAPAYVKIEIFNSLGESVSRVVPGLQLPGKHHYHFDSQDLPTGVYFYRVITEQQVLQQAMLLLR